jgi:diguanylate cyclase
VSIRGAQLRLGLFAAVLVLLCVNALALWGDEVAHAVQTVIQSVIGAGAILSGLVVARRVSGIQRWWRLLAVAAVVGWLVAEVLWWFSEGPTGHGIASTLCVAAYTQPRRSPG